jgi:hypothetical protein
MLTSDRRTAPVAKEWMPHRSVVYSLSTVFAIATLSFPCGGSSCRLLITNPGTLRLTVKTVSCVSRHYLRFSSARPVRVPTHHLHRR